jgi:hypothetical protein
MDPAVQEIYCRGLSGLYSDLHEHRLVGRYRLSREVRREVARAILFLKSDLDYEWSRPALWQELLWMVAGLLTLRSGSRFYLHWMGIQGEAGRLAVLAAGGSRVGLAETVLSRGAMS